MARFISDDDEWLSIMGILNSLAAVDRALPEKVTNSGLGSFMFFEDFCFVESEGLEILQSLCRSTGESSFYVTMTSPAPDVYKSDLGCYPGLEVGVSESANIVASQLFYGPGPAHGGFSDCFSILFLFDRSARWCITVCRSLEITVFAALSRDLAKRLFSLASGRKHVFTIEEACDELVSLAVHAECYDEIRGQLVANYGPDQYGKEGGGGPS